MPHSERDIASPPLPPPNIGASKQQAEDAKQGVGFYRVTYGAQVSDRPPQPAA